jgi:RND family efflux transporter MFP subunit
MTDKPDITSLRIDRNPPPAPPEGKRFPWKFIVPAAVVIAAGLFYAWARGGAPVEVEIVTAALTFPSQANSVLNASGYVVAQRKAAVASKGTGRLVYLGVEEGDPVTKGEIIGRLEDSDVRAALHKARADLEIAKADSFDARTSLERMRTLRKSALASQAELDGAEARFMRVMATIVSARAGVEAADVALENTLIRAPFDGTVLTKNADVGEVVAPFAASVSSRAAVVSMADMASLQVEADVSESNITRVTEGQPCEITLDAYPDKRYRGYVHKIVPTADRAKATVLTKVAFRETDERVLPEMSAKVSFLSKELPAGASAAGSKLTLPASALLERDGRTVVFLVRDNRAIETPVVTGERLGALIEIKEGIAQGDPVVNRPPAGFSSGTTVKTK